MTPTVQEDLKQAARVVEKAVEHLHHHPGRFHDERTLGQRAADAVSTFVGSWVFIGLYILLTFGWVTINVVYIKGFHHFDPYPFIFYTFSVSVLAILMSSLILLAENRQSEIDRAHAENSYMQVSELDDLQKEQMHILEYQNEEIKRLGNIEELLKEIVGLLKNEAERERPRNGSV